MKAGLVLLPFVICVGGALAQAPPPLPAAVPVVGEQLTATEKFALNSIAEKNKLVQDQQKAIVDALRQVEADIAKAHPGYRFNETTGGLEKDVPPPAQQQMQRIPPPAKK